MVFKLKLQFLLVLKKLILHHNNFQKKKESPYFWNVKAQKTGTVPKKGGQLAGMFSPSRSHQSMLQHSGDMLIIFKFLYIATGIGQSIISLNTFDFLKIAVL